MAGRSSNDVLCQSCSRAMAVSFVKGKHYCQKCIDSRNAAMKEVKKRLRELNQAQAMQG